LRALVEGPYTNDRVETTVTGVEDFIVQPFEAKA
jgi:phage host-nuclease inhibitor protein Gam